jgi:hypothetical protein
MSIDLDMWDAIVGKHSEILMTSGYYQGEKVAMTPGTGIGWYSLIDLSGVNYLGRSYCLISKSNYLGLVHLTPLSLLSRSKDRPYSAALRGDHASD